MWHRRRQTDNRQQTRTGCHLSSSSVAFTPPAAAALFTAAALSQWIIYFDNINFYRHKLCFALRPSSLPYSLRHSRSCLTFNVTFISSILAPAQLYDFYLFHLITIKEWVRTSAISDLIDIRGRLIFYESTFGGGRASRNDESKFPRERAIQKQREIKSNSKWCLRQWKKCSFRYKSTESVEKFPPLMVKCT